MGTFEVVPSNENSTREWFAHHLSELPYSIIESGAAFPDYTLRHDDGTILRTEIEFDSRNFVQHGHKITDCDLIICWIHTRKLPLPVYELETRKLFAPNECDVVPKEIPHQYVVKAEKNAKKLRDKKRAAVKMAREEHRDFILKLNADMNEWVALTKTFQPTRFALLAASEKLENALRANGYNIPHLHPYDLAHELIGLVEP